MHVWRAVRCCCQPQKIFGFMLVEESAKKLILREENGFDFQFPIEVMGKRCDSNTYDPLMQEEMPKKIVVTRELAIKSEDHSIDFWRKQEGFVEAEYNE